MTSEKLKNCAIHMCVISDGARARVCVRSCVVCARATSICMQLGPISLSLTASLYAAGGAPPPRYCMQLVVFPTPLPFSFSLSHDVSLCAVFSLSV
jgi:hypothetical protein